MSDDSEKPLLTCHRITVLLVDDQRIIGESVRRMLVSQKDIDFHYCQDPTDAIRAANTIGPTVILQDLVMPEIEGLRLVRYFRANPATRDVPLIVLSSEEDPKTKAEAFALGANDYLVKLPDRLELIARIRYHSRGYINLLERNEAYNALLESQAQLERRNQFIREIFGRYLSDDVVENILSTPGGTRLGGEKRRVTIMMTDLRGFTAITERLPAEHVVTMINHYLTTMTDIIMRYQGTIDEFIGDAILAIFGAPIPREDDAQRACACAVEMQLAMSLVNELNRRQGLPEVSQGIGLNTGEIVVGNIGSEKRAKYGVVGRNVNLTSRIESYTVGGQILISDATLEACGGLLRIDGAFEVLPKGTRLPIVIHELGGIGPPHDLYLPPKSAPEWRELSPPLLVQYSILEDKHTRREARAGEIRRAVGHLVQMRGTSPLERMVNIRVSFLSADGEVLADEIYGKVTEIEPDNENLYRVNLTSVPAEAAEILRQRLPMMESS